MKSLIRILPLFFLISNLFAAPRLHLSDKPLPANGTMEVIFDQAVVPADKIGQESENTLLNFQPAWAGKITWRSQTIARFTPSEAPKIGTLYQVSLPAGQKYLDQSAIPETNFESFSTTAFQQVAVISFGQNIREAKTVLIYNDSVEATQAAAFFQFHNEAGLAIAARTRQASWDDFTSAYYLRPTWPEQFAGWTRPDSEKMKPETLIKNALFIEPITPLPIGKNWRLSTLAGLPNAAQTAGTSAINQRFLGNIDPFKLTSAHAITRPDRGRMIQLRFNQSVAEDMSDEEIAKNLTLGDDALKISLSWDSRRQNLTLSGDFERKDNWHISVEQKLRSSLGLPMVEKFSKNVIFKRLQPGLSLPSNEESQFAFGSREYEVTTLNMKSARLRVKRLKPEELVRAYQGYRRYTGKSSETNSSEKETYLPYDLISGKTITDQVIPLDNAFDTTQSFSINWDEPPLAGQRFGSYFVSVDGQPKDHLKLKETRPKVAQALIQLTDIGLAWKLTENEALVYAYSCQTGLPLENVDLQVFADDAEKGQSQKTDAAGLATLRISGDNRHLLAKLGLDQVVIPFDQTMPSVSMWNFPVSFAHHETTDKPRRVLMFTDRNLYRPGETFRLKGMVRLQNDHLLELPKENNPTLTLFDAAGRNIHEEVITLSDSGSFDFEKQLPPSQVGYFRLTLEWPELLAEAENEKDWYRAQAIRDNAHFFHGFYVQEFKRNAYEIKSELSLAAIEASPQNDEAEKQSIKLDYQLDAKYFQGAAVSEGKVSYHLSAHPTGFYPEQYRDFLFGDHRQYDPYYWYHYYGYSENSYYEKNGGSNQSGEFSLDKSGHLTHQFSVETAEFPTPMEISLHSDVTDAREQTLSQRESLTVHPSVFYLGVSRADKLTRIKDEIPFKVLAVTNSGERFEQAVTAKITVSREFNTQTKSKAPNGKIVVQNETHREEILSQELTLNPGEKSGSEFVFTPEKAGSHIFEFESSDPEGKRVRTVFSRHVYGSQEYPWIYEDGQRIKLVSEQKIYRAGDTARILVLSPIEGTALVTIERKGVLSHFRADLKADNPVIEFPVTDDYAPNAYVSVLIIKGLQDNSRKHKEPQLRLGYCQLNVEPTQARLAVTLASEKPYTRPGEQISVRGKVVDFQGKAVANAEVTFYAEDEGTLAVMGYENPDALKNFHSARPLQVKSGTSLELFISENPAERYHANKGFFVGGGDEMGAEVPRDLLRRHFDPCAAWFPKLHTDADGHFTATFPAPDTLTRYRLIAVAQHGAEKFGTGLSDTIVSKPVMLEPNPPRFASQGDCLQPSALIQNTTKHEGTWQVSLKLNSLASALGSEEKSLTKTIRLAADAQESVVFDVQLNDTGTATWVWHAEPSEITTQSLDDALRRELSDTVESTFEVHYPMPLLSEIHFVSLDNKSHDLLRGFSPELLEGQGTLNLEFSRSRLLEAAGAADFLLTYPYGCLEQTTSATIPWIAANALRHLSPKLQKKTEAEIAEAIQAGADRILSMQKSNGGFSYWVNQSDSADWASAYGGFGLLLCKEAGASVPDDALMNLARYLKNQLAGSAKVKSSYELEKRALALYVLARLGQSDAASQNNFLARQNELSKSGRAFLALALHHSEGDENVIMDLLNNEVPTPADDGRWMAFNNEDAHQLLALATISPAHPACEKTLDLLLRTRHSQGHWRTTWNNGWSLLALAQYATVAEKQAAQTIVNYRIGEEKFTLTLDEQTTSQVVSVPLSAGLKIEASSDTHVYLRSHLIAKPKLQPFQPVASNGLEITRLYERVKKDGSLEALNSPKVGDLVKVTLKLVVPRADMRYFAIDDPLPANFEAINTDFASQAGRVQNNNSWQVSNQEIRSDRVLFFIDRVYQAGEVELNYHARITTAGQATAPPAKVELMYAPENFALSASENVDARK